MNAKSFNNRMRDLWLGKKVYSISNQMEKLFFYNRTRTWPFWFKTKSPICMSKKIKQYLYSLYVNHFIRFITR